MCVGRRLSDSKGACDFKKRPQGPFLLNRSVLVENTCFIDLTVTTDVVGGICFPVLVLAFSSLIHNAKGQRSATVWEQTRPTTSLSRDNCVEQIVKPLVI